MKNVTIPRWPFIEAIKRESRIEKQIRILILQNIFLLRDQKETLQLLGVHSEMPKIRE